LFYPKYIDTGDYYAPVAEGSSHYNDVLDDFRVYWNVPTFQCHKYGYNFTEVAEWGIQQNADDDFRGDKINLLYDPGLFPALMQGGGSERSDYVVRNGGVPHEGNLTKHLDIFSRDVVTKLVPDPKFSGKLYVSRRRVYVWRVRRKSEGLRRERDHANLSEN
jgi:hyaluronoglucosaminidase